MTFHELRSQNATVKLLIGSRIESCQARRQTQYELFNYLKLAKFCAHVD